MTRFFFIVFVLFITLSAMSQTGGITGLVLDEQEQLPLPGATVLLQNLQDSLLQEGTITALDGSYHLQVSNGSYALQVSFMGFKIYRDTLLLEDKPLELATIVLAEETEVLEEIKVVSNLAPTFQRGDTTLYNPAAFKVSLDATANDLLLKMPGFYEVDGKMLALGDTIKEVLVDGKRFFGFNVNEALRSIRPEMIKDIEVYQYKSDEARHSGFEDMNGGQTVNIVTKEQKNSMLFGELAAGIGKDDRYVGEASLNRYSEKNRMNVSGGVNNANVPIKVNQGSPRQSISGNKMEQKRLNANYGLMGRQELNVNYSYNDQQSENISRNSREYISGATAGQANLSERTSDNTSLNNQVRMNWSSPKSEKYQLRVSARLGNSKRESTGLTNASTLMNGELLNANKRLNSSNNESNRINTQLNFIRRLNDKGSAVSANVGLGVNQSEGDGSLLSETRNGSDELVQAVNQISNNERTNTNLNYGLNYNQALSPKSNLNFGYSFSHNSGQSLKTSYDYEEESDSYAHIDSLTSSDFNNTSTVHQGRLAFKTGDGKTNLYVGVNVSQTELESEEVFPKTEQLRETFLFFEPQVKYSIQTDKKMRWQFSYAMSNSNPSLRNLQSVVDNSNPLYISTGNPELKSSRTHNTTISLSKSYVEKGVFMSLNLRGSMTNDMVAQNRVVAQNDTVIMGEYLLPAGGQFSSPINLDGNFRMSMFGTLGLPINTLKSKLNMRTELSFANMPNIINNVKSYSKRYNISQSFTLSSNISEKIDFTLSSNSSFSLVDGRNGSSAQSNYFTQRSGLNLYYNFYKKFIFKTNTGHNYTGASGSLASNSRLYLNLSLSTKLFKDNKGEISLSGYDLTNNVDEMRRTVDEFSVSESYQPTLNQFVMLSFAYRI
ncbi:TonB-dependent receptor [Carboxylicivirga sp. A043]|uniref:outer membrane beta-barrel protein n=1 Tax=Carboxylicivirga litoralis TaxID=2816963 RepID=UPI0021CB447E|nr:outer membrane beta-barrel protein [Carboxylicivirga sp. A043]MCU4155683.1 TonB-dependent receptor [Carboxylicivirga sp. A043]